MHQLMKNDFSDVADLFMPRLNSAPLVAEKEELPALVEQRGKLLTTEGDAFEVFALRSQYGAQISFLLYPPDISAPIVDNTDGRFGQVYYQTSPLQHVSRCEGLPGIVLPQNSSINLAPLRGKEALIVLPATIDAIVQAAGFLGPVPSPLLMAVLEAKNGVRELTNRLVLLTLAGSMIDSSGKVKNQLDFEGEKLLIQAMSGDHTARSELEVRSKALSKMREQTHSRERPAAPPISLEKLMAISIRRELPEYDSRTDSYLLCHPHDHSGGKSPRVSIHFTENCLVQANVPNNWAESSFVLMCPLNSMIQMNGMPENLDSVDTFFTTMPGVPLKLRAADTTIVRPSCDLSENSTVSLSNDGRTCFYATDRFTRTRVLHLCEQLRDNDLLAPILLEAVDPGRRFRSKIENRINPMEALGIVLRSGLPELVTLLGKLDFESAQTRMDRALVPLAKRAAVMSVMRTRGFNAEPGGQRSWGDTGKSTHEFQETARYYGTRSGPHEGSPADEVESRARDRLRCKSMQYRERLQLGATPKTLIAASDPVLVACYISSGLRR